MSADPPQTPPPARDLAPIVYDELRRLAAAYMRRERPGQTLQATALVHEAYLRLAGAGTPWHDERHFVGIAARSMRQILVERARARGAQKRWGGLEPGLDDRRARGRVRAGAMLPALDEALTRLEQIDAEQARIVELRYFAGLSIEDTADALGMSPATLKRRWALARAWLFREMSGCVTPEQRRRVRDLFEAAVDHDPAQRRRLGGAGSPGRSGGARRRCSRCVEHHSRAGAFLVAADRRAGFRSADR